MDPEGLAGMVKYCLDALGPPPTNLRIHRPEGPEVARGKVVMVNDCVDQPRPSSKTLGSLSRWAPARTTTKATSARIGALQLEWELPS